MRKIVTWLGISAIGIACSALAQDRGLVPSPGGLGGPFWQSRFERDLSGSVLSQPGVDTLGLATAQPQALRLLGDYQFSALRLGDTGGLRLTGGMLINLRQTGLPGMQAPDGGSALPYAGVGYASGSQRGDWGFSADLGLSAQGLGSLRLDRLFTGANGLSADGGLRLQPMVRLGMNLAF